MQASRRERGEHLHRLKIRIHDFAKTWAQRHFKTADGKPIAHANLVSDLLEAVQLPSKVAIVKVKGHSVGDDEIAIGNADEAPKQAALSGIKAP
ncbi:MAG: hypothetical protein ACRCVN_01150 [Spirochaetia bacterium]